MSLVQTFGSLKLKFVVWDKDMIGKDFLGKNALSINEWFKETAIAFDDPGNKVRPFTAEGTKRRDLHPLRSPFESHSFLHPRSKLLVGP